MKRDEFMERYHEYQTLSREEAERECAAVMVEAEGFVPVVQTFDFGGNKIIYGLMSKGASDLLTSLGIDTSGVGWPSEIARASLAAGRCPHGHQGCCGHHDLEDGPAHEIGQCPSVAG